MLVKVMYDLDLKKLLDLIQQNTHYTTVYDTRVVGTDKVKVVDLTVTCSDIVVKIEFGLGSIYNDVDGLHGQYEDEDYKDIIDVLKDSAFKIDINSLQNYTVKKYISKDLVISNTLGPIDKNDALIIISESYDESSFIYGSHLNNAYFSISEMNRIETLIKKKFLEEIPDIFGPQEDFSMGRSLILYTILTSKLAINDTCEEAFELYGDIINAINLDYLYNLTFKDNYETYLVYKRYKGALNNLKLPLKELLNTMLGVIAKVNKIDRDIEYLLTALTYYKDLKMKRVVVDNSICVTSTRTTTKGNYKINDTVFLKFLSEELNVELDSFPTAIQNDSDGALSYMYDGYGFSYSVYKKAFDIAKSRLITYGENTLIEHTKELLELSDSVGLGSIKTINSRSMNEVLDLLKKDFIRI